MTTRGGGVSTGAFRGLNLREGLGDDESAVQHNRQRLEAACGVPVHRLQQVHGVHVLRVGQTAASGPPWPEADASVTTTAGQACEIQVADCLPVLFADRRGQVVAAAHAGWRRPAWRVLPARGGRTKRSAALVVRSARAGAAAPSGRRCHGLVR